MAAYALYEFQVQQMGRVPCFALCEKPVQQRNRRSRGKQRFQQSGSVQNDQRLSRSARIASSCDSESVTGGKLASLSRISSIVGISATFLTSDNK